MSTPPSSGADYAIVPMNEHLGPTHDALDVPWATFVGDRTDPHAFEVTADHPRDAYVQIQAFEVGELGHELSINGEPLGGFDLPVRDGWGLWMDTIDDGLLAAGENELRVHRDSDGDDAFALGTAIVHWRTE